MNLNLLADVREALESDSDLVVRQGLKGLRPHFLGQENRQRKRDIGQELAGVAGREGLALDIRIEAIQTVVDGFIKHLKTQPEDLKIVGENLTLVAVAALRTGVGEAAIDALVKLKQYHRGMERGVFEALYMISDRADNVHVAAAARHKLSAEFGFGWRPRLAIRTAQSLGTRLKDYALRR